jgi:hypothetical protein
MFVRFKSILQDLKLVASPHPVDVDPVFGFAIKYDVVGTRSPPTVLVCSIRGFVGPGRWIYRGADDGDHLIFENDDAELLGTSIGVPGVRPVFINIFDKTSQAFPDMDGYYLKGLSTVNTGAGPAYSCCLAARAYWATVVN